MHIDEEIVIDMCCPYCHKDESISVRPLCESIDDAIELFAEEEREEPEFDDQYIALELDVEDEDLDDDDDDDDLFLEDL